MSATKLHRLNATPEETEEVFRILEVAALAYPDLQLQGALWHVADPEKYSYGEVGDGLAVFLAMELIEVCIGNAPSDMVGVAVSSLETAGMELAGVFNAVSRLHEASHVLRYDVPEDLSPAGRTAVQTITTALLTHGDPCLGGCTPWYSPQAWAAREEEELDEEAVLIVVHDGRGLSYAFNRDKGDYRLYDHMQDALKQAGFWCEPLNCWSVAIYQSENHENDPEQLLHIMMQLHLQEHKFLTLKELKKETEWDTARLCAALKHDWFDQAWIEEGEDRRGIAYFPSSEAFDYVAMLFYSEAYTPFKLDRAVLEGEKEVPWADRLRNEGNVSTVPIQSVRRIIRHASLQLPPVEEEDLHTIIAALNYYYNGGQGEPQNRSEAIHDLATNGGECISRDAEGIDALIVLLNTESSVLPSPTTSS